MQGKSSGRKREQTRTVAVCVRCGRLFHAWVYSGGRVQQYHDRACWKASLTDPVTRFWSYVDRSGGPGACWPWTASVRDKGYGQLFWKGRSARKAHRVAWEVAIGPIPSGMNVLHGCDAPACCNPAHLFLGTVGENNADMWAKGRHWLQRPGERRRGERHGGAKLTEDAVRAIRQYAAQGWSQYVLAEKYGVRQRTIWAVIHRKTWKHVP